MANTGQFPGGEQDGVLAVKAGGKGQGGQRRRADQETPEHHRQAGAQATHAENIVLVVQAVDDRSCGEEQQRLEKGMGYQVENAGGVGADAKGQEHVTDLADGGVGQDALDIVLGQGGESGQQQGGQADPGDGFLGGRRQLEQAEGAGDQVDPGGHHGGRVDQGADRGGARHRVGQPGVQRQLRRLAHRATQQQGGGENGQGVADLPLAVGGGQQRLDIEGAEFSEQQEQAQGHGSVADAGNHEGLARGAAVGRVPVPEADQQVGADPHALPAQVEQQQVVGHYQQQHGADEQVHVGEIAADRFVFPHELNGIKMDQEAHPGDHRHHHHRESVNIKCDAGCELAHRHPGPERELAHLAVGQEGASRQRHADRRQAHRARTQPRGDLPWHAARAQQQQGGTGQGEQWNEPDCRHQPLSLLAWSMSRVLKRRWICSTRPSPTATSAAATVRISRKIIWPSAWLHFAPAATKASAAALSMTSSDINMKMILRRSISPRRPQLNRMPASASTCSIGTCRPPISASAPV